MYCWEMDSGLSLHGFPPPLLLCVKREGETEREQETEQAGAESILLVCLER